MKQRESKMSEMIVANFNDAPSRTQIEKNQAKDIFKK